MRHTKIIPLWEEQVLPVMAADRMHRELFLENDIKRYSRERESDKTKGEVSGAYLQNSLKVLPSKEEVGCLWMRTQLYSCTTSVWWVDFLGS